jgi:hypothetical protein
MKFFSSFFPPTHHNRGTTADQVAPEKKSYKIELLDTDFKRIVYLGRMRKPLREAKILSDFFTLLQPLETIPFSNGVSVSVESLLKRVEEYIHTKKSHASNNSVDIQKKNIIEDLNLASIDTLPEFQDTLAKLIQAAIIAEDIETPSSEKEALPLVQEEKLEIPHMEEQGVDSLREELHSSPLLIPENEALVQEATDAVSHIVTAADDVSTAIAIHAQEGEVAHTTPTHSIEPDENEAPGREEALLTPDELDETEPKIEMEALTKSAPLTRTTFTRQPRNFLKRVKGIGAGIETFVQHEEEVLIRVEKSILRSPFIRTMRSRFVQKNTLLELHTNETSTVFSREDRGLFRHRTKRTTVPRLIGVQPAHVTVETILQQEHKKNTPTSSVLRSKSSLKQEKPLLHQFKNIRTTPSEEVTQITPTNRNTSIEEASLNLQTLASIRVEESKVTTSEAPTVPPMIHVVKEGETIRTIVQDHLMKQESFALLSDKEKYALVSKYIVSIDKQGILNVNTPEVGAQINLFAIDATISKDTVTTANPFLSRFV